MWKTSVTTGCLLSWLQFLFKFNFMSIIFRQTCMLFDCFSPSMGQFLLNHRQLYCRHFSHLKIVSYFHFLNSHGTRFYIWQYIYLGSHLTFERFLHSRNLTPQRLLNGKAQQLDNIINRMSPAGQLLEL